MNESDTIKIAMHLLYPAAVQYCQLPPRWPR
jgi:hypothetical protein